MFKPNYMNIVNAAQNKKSDRIPLYEHNISPIIMERITNKNFAHFFNGDYNDKLLFFKHYNEFQLSMGYDAITFECCVCGAMPLSGCLSRNQKSRLVTISDFEKYPWKDIPDIYFDYYSDTFKALRATMPDGMRAIGGVGNGIFECVQDIVGLENLCYLKIDEEELYYDLFEKAGEMLATIWERFLYEFGDIYCVCRFGDDLGFKSATLLTTDDNKQLIIPQYKKIIDIIHRYDKPFLLHSCGNIFEIMEDMISVAKIDAKHSNEEQIAPFKEWIDRYGERIGNFGGIDTDCLCDLSMVNLDEYVKDVFKICEQKGRGVAIGSGNSIPDYVSTDKYVQMINLVRKLRGE